MAKTLSFDTGINEYDINGAVKVRFNPADEGFITKLYDTISSLEITQSEFVNDTGDAREFFESFKSLDESMRATIDGLLGEGVSDAVFPNINCYALADGLPVWVNLLLAITDEIENALSEEQGKSDPRLSKISERNKRLIEKYKNN